MIKFLQSPRFLFYLSSQSPSTNLARIIRLRCGELYWPSPDSHEPVLGAPAPVRPCATEEERSLTPQHQNAVTISRPAWIYQPLAVGPSWLRAVALYLVVRHNRVDR